MGKYKVLLDDQELAEQRTARPSRRRRTTPRRRGGSARDDLFYRPEINNEFVSQPTEEPAGQVTFEMLDDLRRSRFYEVVEAPVSETAIPPTEPESCPPVTRASDAVDSTQLLADGSDAAVDDVSGQYHVYPENRVYVPDIEIETMGPTQWATVVQYYRQAGYFMDRPVTADGTYFIRPARRVAIPDRITMEGGGPTYAD